MREVHSKRAFGYIRVSTDQQAERGDSLAVQRKAIELICELEGFDLVDVFADPGTSGGVALAKRPEGSRLLAAVNAGDVIVGVKLDRVFRDATDATGTLKLLRKRGVGLYLKDLGGDVTDSSVSALVFGLLSNVAEFEVARRSERIREVKAANRAVNRFLGGASPLGYVVEVDDMTGKKRIVVDVEAHNLARQLRAQGYSARMAAGAMKAHGYKASDKSVSKLWATMDESTVAVG